MKKKILVALILICVLAITILGIRRYQEFDRVRNIVEDPLNPLYSAYICKYVKQLENRESFEYQKYEDWLRDQDIFDEELTYLLSLEFKISKIDDQWIVHARGMDEDFDGRTYRWSELTNQSILFKDGDLFLFSLDELDCIQ